MSLGTQSPAVTPREAGVSASHSIVSNFAESVIDVFASPVQARRSSRTNSASWQDGGGSRMAAKRYTASGGCIPIAVGKLLCFFDFRLSTIEILAVTLSIAKTMSTLLQTTDVSFK